MIIIDEGKIADAYVSLGNHAGALGGALIGAKLGHAFAGGSAKRKALAALAGGAAGRWLGSSAGESFAKATSSISGAYKGAVGTLGGALGGLTGASAAHALAGAKGASANKKLAYTLAGGLAGSLVGAKTGHSAADATTIPFMALKAPLKGASFDVAGFPGIGAVHTANNIGGINYSNKKSENRKNDEEADKKHQKREEELRKKYQGSIMYNVLSDRNNKLARAAILGLRAKQAYHGIKMFNHIRNMYKDRAIGPKAKDLRGLTDHGSKLAKAWMADGIINMADKTLRRSHRILKNREEAKAREYNQNTSAEGKKKIEQDKFKRPEMNIIKGANNYAKDRTELTRKAYRDGNTEFLVNPDGKGKINKLVGKSNTYRRFYDQREGSGDTEGKLIGTIQHPFNFVIGLHKAKKDKDNYYYWKARKAEHDAKNKDKSKDGKSSK